MRNYWLTNCDLYGTMFATELVTPNYSQNDCFEFKTVTYNPIPQSLDGTLYDNHIRIGSFNNFHGAFVCDTDKIKEVILEEGILRVKLQENIAPSSLVVSYEYPRS